jgi:hypothetical protein
MAFEIIYSRPIPEGMSVLESYLSVAGISHRKDDVIAFVEGKGHRLEFRAEPRNPQDRNAIKVFGVSKGWLFWRKRHIGYVPTEVAQEIADAGLIKKIALHLDRIWVGGKDDGHDDTVISIRFDLLVPKLPKESKARRKKQ